MARIRDLPNPLGVSFLDLVCCAMAATLILFLLSDVSEPSPPKRDGTLGFVTITLKDQASGEIAARLVIDGEPFPSWSPSPGGAVLWQPKPGGLIGLVMKQPKKPLKLEVLVSRLEAEALGKPVALVIETMGTTPGGIERALAPSDLYRGSFEISASGWKLR